MTFIIHFKDGHRETYSNRYDEEGVLTPQKYVG